MLEPLNPRRTGRAAAAGRRALRVIAWLLAPVLLYWVAGLFLYRFVTPAVTPLMLIRSLERGEMIWQQGAPLQSVARALREAVVVAEDAGRLVLRTRIGSHRLLERLSGEQLPRIC